MPPVIHVRFSANDNTKKLGHPAFMPVSDSESMSREAFTRLSELTRDMGWNKTYTIGVFYREIAQPLGQGDKSIKQWFDREAVPLVHIFNIATVLGIHPSWIAGLPKPSKEDAIDEFGLYARVTAGRQPAPSRARR